MKKGIYVVVENAVAETKRASPWIRVVQNGLLLAASLGICIGLIELGLRTLHITSELQYEPNPFYGWTHVPNSTVTRRIADTVVTIHINQHGMRENVEYTYEKPPGVFRILVLGDSFAEAVQVQHDEAFPKLIEATLNTRRFPGVNRVEVINAGTSGYGTDNELLFYLAEGHKYSPDLVLLAFCICNDVRNNWYELDNVEAGEFRKPYFMLGPEGLSLHRYPFEQEPDPLRPAKTFLNQNVRLYTFLREARDRFNSKQTIKRLGIPLDYQIYRKDYSPRWKTAWKVTEALLAKIHTEVSKHGTPLFVAVIPTHFQVQRNDWQTVLDTFDEMKSYEWDLDKPSRIVTDILRRLQIPHVDLLPALRSRAQHSEEQFYIPSDGHWTASGHKLAAQVILDHLLRNGFGLKDTVINGLAPVRSATGSAILGRRKQSTQLDFTLLHQTYHLYN